MGILDDAIREHLELKRKAGAEGEDLERLEKEAFGPPERPGEEDSTEQPLPDADAEGASGEAGPEGRVRDLADGPDWADGLETGEEDLSAGARPEPPSGEQDLAGPEAGETPAEQARIEHSHLQDTVDHPAVEEDDGPRYGREEPTSDVHEALEPASEEQELEPPSEEQGAVEAGSGEDATPEAASEEREAVAPAEAVEPAAEPQAAGEEPVEAPEAGIFDADADLELDLDLDIDDEPVADAGVEGTPGTEDFELELPDDSATEHPLPDTGATEPGTGEEEVGAEFTEDAADEDDAEDEEEDLLEETPDFLEDTPEGERLWFEQSGPKDFDFDED